MDKQQAISLCRFERQRRQPKFELEYRRLMEEAQKEYDAAMERDRQKRLSKKRKPKP